MHYSAESDIQLSSMDIDIIDRDDTPSPSQNQHITDTLLRYALYSRLAYFDFDVTTDDLCVVGHHGCIDKIRFIDKADTQLWIFEDSSRDEMVIAFRGSDSMGDILTNFCIIPEQFLFPNHGTCHGGHMKCYKTVRNDIMIQVQKYIKRGGKKVTVCGHSLGGACAAICALDLALASSLNVSCFSYGALAFADRKFCDSLKHHVPNSFRVVHSDDFAPFIPMLFYRHYDDSQTCISISTTFSHPHNVDTPSPLQTLHSKMMYYIRHHSIESYIAGLRKLGSKSNASITHSHTRLSLSKPKPTHMPYKNLTPPTINKLSSSTTKLRHNARRENAPSRSTNRFSRFA